MHQTVYILVSVFLFLYVFFQAIRWIAHHTGRLDKGMLSDVFGSLFVLTVSALSGSFVAHGLVLNSKTTWVGVIAVVLALCWLVSEHLYNRINALLRGENYVKKIHLTSRSVLKLGVVAGLFLVLVVYTFFCK